MFTQKSHQKIIYKNKIYQPVKMTILILKEETQNPQEVKAR